MTRARALACFGLAALTGLAAGCGRAPEETTPAQITERIRTFAAAQCGPDAPTAGFEPGYLRVVDISKDGTPDYAVDFSALRCGGDRPILCGEDGCPREIWVSDGRGSYVEALGVHARSFELNVEATPPTVTVTVTGDSCPPPPDPPPAQAQGSVAPRPQAERVCRKTFVFDPIQLDFLDADRPGAQIAPTEPPPATPNEGL